MNYLRNLLLTAITIISLAACSPRIATAPAQDDIQLQDARNTEMSQASQTVPPGSSQTPVMPSSTDTITPSPLAIATATATPLSMIKIDPNNYATLDIMRKLSLEFGSVADVAVNGIANQLIVATTKGLVVVDINSFTKRLEVPMDLPALMIAASDVEGQVGLITKDKAGILNYVENKWILEIPGKTFTAIDVFSENDLLALGLYSGEIDLYKISTGEKVHTLQGHYNSITDLDFDLTGAFLVSSSKDLTAKVWSVLSGNKLTTYYGHDQWVRVVTFSPNGNNVATGCDDDLLRVFSTSSGDLLYQSNPLSAEIISIDYNPDGSLLALCDTLNYCRIFSTVDWKSRTKFSNTQQPVDILFSPEGNLVFVALKDGSLLVYGIKK